MKNSLVSIIIPTFNRAQLLGETLDSVLEQTYVNWECLVIDDGSIDKTEEVLRNYQEKDDRFKFFTRPENRKKGASSCRNYGLEISTGDYIQFLDSDDLLGKKKLEEQLRLLTDKPSSSLVTCRWGSFSNPDNKKIKIKYHSYKNFKEGEKLLTIFGKFDEYFPAHAYLISKDIVKITGPWNEDLSNNDDGEYFTRILLHSSPVIFCESAAVYYRAGNSGRLSVLDNKEKIKSAMKSWELIQEHLGNPTSRYVKNGKRNIFDQIRRSYPEIIEENPSFFAEIIEEKRWFRLYK